MQAAFSYRFKGQQLWLSPDRCIFWEEEKCLIVSDLHFGKTGHFRKSGIAVPPSVYKEDLQRLLSLIQYFQPRELLVVGDLFHSRENKELALFRKWREDLSHIAIRLIKGNHDILQEDWYLDAGIAVSPETWQIGEFAFIHDITTMAAMVGAGAAGPGPGVAASGVTPAGVASTAGAVAAGAYCFSGHIHPGIRINGLGRQSLRFPCFYFGSDYAVLPAFSRFTGMASIDPGPGEQVFAILPSAPSKGAYGNIVQIQ